MNNDLDMTSILTTRDEDIMWHSPEIADLESELHARQAELAKFMHPTDGFAQDSPFQIEWNQNAELLLMIAAGRRHENDKR